MSAPQRVAAIVVGVLVVVGVAVVGLSLAGAGTAVDPGSPSPSVQPPASVAPDASPSPTDDPDPSPADDAEILAGLDAIEEQVIAIRGLEAADIGPPDLISRAELGEELDRIFAEEYPPDELAADNATLRALGLLGPDQDVAELLRQLLGDQVLGFYDDTDKRMVVVTDAGLDAQAKLTYAHEYAHALQDAAFDLASLEVDVEGQDDRGLARTALIEGDATVTMLAWGIENLTPEELAEIGTTPLPDTTGIPSWLVEQVVVFPYNEGYVWASELARDPFAPDFDAIDAAFADPPDSTEQIIDLDKWTEREAPVDVRAVDLAAAMGEGWTEVDETPIGEATIRMMLEFFGVPHEEAVAAASGWGGDRAVIVTGPSDAFAVAWRLAWDTTGDADEFADAYQDATGALGFPATVTRLTDGEVLVVHGSSEEILRRALDAADG